MASPREIIQTLANLPSESLETDAQVKKQVIDLSRQLSSSLSNPVTEAILLAIQPSISFAARVAVDLDLFALIDKSAEPITSQQLAEQSKAEEVLITRILRLLAAGGFVKQVFADSWTSTPTTKALALPFISAGHRFVWDILIKGVIEAPKYLRETSYRNPVEPCDGFIQYAHQTKRDVFGLMREKPSILNDFNNYMGHTIGEDKYWVDWFPVRERVVVGHDPDTVLLVDVAGGRGHDIRAFRAKFPGQERLVLQDLPQGLESVFNKEGAAEFKKDAIELVPYNFFTEQPIRGARAYFFHHILHDWSDKYCLEILSHVYKAMKPQYSKIVIHELILPEQNATRMQTYYDIAMMTLNSGMERSRSQWTSLLEAAGFKAIQFWVDGEDVDGIIEAVRE